MVEIYAIRIPSTIRRELYDHLASKIDESKKERLERFVREEDRLRGLFAELLIRSIIMRKTGMKNEEITFEANQYGKPHIKGRDDLHFNLSHSGIWVVAAVDTEPVGIDVERISDVDLSISKNYFSEDEHNDLMGQRDKISYFFTLWTLKESYIKITGKGLTQPLNSFSIQYVTEDRILLKSDTGRTVEGVTFAQYNIHSDYKMMLCASHNHLPKDVIMHPTDLLIRKFMAAESPRARRY